MGKPARGTIQINGRTYDALSGRPVPATAHVQPSKPAAKAKRTLPHTSGRAIDGVVAKPVHRRPPAKAVHARAKKAHTLNRTGVKKARTAPHQPAPAAAQVASTHGLDSQRAERARHVHKSKAISKFGGGDFAPAKTAPIIETEKAIEVSAPAAPLSAKEELIAQHLAQVATASSTQTKAKKSGRVKQWLKQPRRTTVLAMSASAVLLAGYITYINIPNMSLRVASSRAGFAAHLPGYQPAGFAFDGPVAYQPGEITVGYGSAGGDRRYTIVQKESNWDSQTLLDYIEPQAELYPATYQESGLTVYIYDGEVATWINAGVWYTINNDSADLTTEQMLKIAASL